MTFEKLSSVTTPLLSLSPTPFSFLFAAPTYANAKLRASYNEYSASDDAWEFGVGGGIGYQFADKASAEITYEQFDGTDVVNFGLKFAF